MPIVYCLDYIRCMNALKQTVKYLQYYFFSKTKHDIHPPFLFDFINQVLNDKKQKSQYNEVEKYRSFLLQNTTQISCPNIGAPSKTLKQKSHSVKQIAKTSAVSKNSDNYYIEWLITTSLKRY